MARTERRPPARDQVDELLSQWERERPDLELEAMGIIGRLGRFSAGATRAIEAQFATHGLTIADFDVLAALRRAGDPFELTPTELSRSLMLSPASMTNRLDRLEAAGHVSRRMDPDDRRSYLVRLTKEGRATVDRAVTGHVQTEAQLLAGIDATERRTLDRILRKLT